MDREQQIRLNQRRQTPEAQEVQRVWGEIAHFVSYVKAFVPRITISDEDLHEECVRFIKKLGWGPKGPRDAA